MSTIAILGAGMMGSALAVPLADKGHSVRLVGTYLDDAIIQSLRQSHTHPKLDLALPVQIQPFYSSDIDQAFDGVDLIALGVSSAGIPYACQQLGKFARPDVPWFMITKGLVFADARLVTLPDEVSQRIAPVAGISPAAIAGPCIAGELARRVPTCIVVTGRDPQTNARIASALQGPYYHTVESTDVVGNEVCAALKNAYAMGIAFATGVHEKNGGQGGSVAMHNLESACFAQAIREMAAIVERVGGDRESVFGLAGVGDLDVTTNGGRTGRFGRWLGRGLSRADAVAAMQGATLECLEILETMRLALAHWSHEEPRIAEQLPLLQHMIDVALGGAEVDLPLAHFFGKAR